MVDLNNCKLLVTGGSGFIGSNFMEYVLNAYDNVTIVNLDKMGIGSQDREFPIKGNNNKLINIPVDIRLLDHMHLGNLVLPDLKYDYVFHFAAESHVDRSINSPLVFISNNVIGTASLLEYCERYQPQARFININTDEVYGHLGHYDDPFTEDSPLAPRSPYAASKAAAGLVAMSYHSTYGMDIVETRCCNNYGPHQHDEKFIPTVIRSLVRNEKIPVYGNGQNIREWIHVHDHNKAVLEIADIGKPGGVYNIGSAVELTNMEIIGLIIDIFHGPDKNINDYVKFVEDRKGHDFRYGIESIKWTNNMNQIQILPGLKLTVEHYKQKYAKR